MKFMLMGFLAIVISQEAFSQDLTIFNKTTPSEKIQMSCLNPECDEMKFEFTVNDIVKNKNIIALSALEARANQKLRRISKHTACWECPYDYYGPYTGLKKTIKNVKRDFNGGYYSSMIGNSLVTILAIVGETIALPITPITYFGQSYRPNKSEKRNAKQVLKVINSEVKEISYKEKIFLKIRNGLSL